ncbi:thiamine pyrophosphate-binding protein [Streptomyces flaveolus]|uniref:Thiamine pyrophosphate-binding protein n=1 Tax=Streptomyces flaveolus TaxID=67297 RepID=A0ABV3AJQ7_9ACTN|nr:MULTISPECIES: thiamine pyrophosphate-binding protein [Streptomyces]
MSEAFYSILRQHGVSAVFGNPGSNELSFLTGLPPDIPYYLALQEGAAIGMADAYAQANSVGPGAARKQSRALPPLTSSCTVGGETSRAAVGPGVHLCGAGSRSPVH